MARRKSSRDLWKAKLEGRQTPAASGLPVPGLKAAFRGTVLGVDPSLRASGFAVVEFPDPPRPLLLHSRTLKLTPSLSMAECLGVIAQTANQLLDVYPVDVAAVEQTIYVQNFQTAQILGAARGAVIAAIAARGLTVYEYPPLRVKQAVVGVGRASKEQVARTVRSLMGHGAMLGFDEADAAAVAVCHAFTRPPEG